MSVNEQLELSRRPKVRKLATDGNRVAQLLVDIWKQNFPSTKLGYEECREFAIDKFDKLAKYYMGTPSPFYTGEPLSQSPFDYHYSNDRSNYSRLLNNAGVVGQVWPGYIGGIPNSPGPLQSMLILGTLGAGAGYGAGKVLDKFQGRNPPASFSQMGTLGGGLLGLLPGAFMLSANLAAGKKPFDQNVLSVSEGGYGKHSRYEEEDPYWSSGSYSPYSRHIPEFTGFLPPPVNMPPQVISVDQVKELVWRDPIVSRQLPLPVAAATTALVEGASRVNRKRAETPFITPNDIGRMAVGLGSGYASGVLIGQVLGGLFGVSDSTKQILRNSGAAAGLIKATIPIVFGG